MSFTRDQQTCVNSLKDRLDGRLRVYHYMKDQMPGHCSVAETLQNWIASSDICMGVYGPEEGFYDPGLGKPVIYWEYEQIVGINRKIFRPFIEKGSIYKTNGTHKDFLINLKPTIQKRPASEFDSEFAFLDSAKDFILFSSLDLEHAAKLRAARSNRWLAATVIVTCVVVSLTLLFTRNTGM